MGDLCVSVVLQRIAVEVEGIAEFNPDVAVCDHPVFSLIHVSAVAIEESAVVVS